MDSRIALGDISFHHAIRLLSCPSSSYSSRLERSSLPTKEKKRERFRKDEEFLILLTAEQADVRESGKPRKIHPAHQVGEARVGAQRIEYWIDLQIDQRGVMVVVVTFQAGQGSIFIS